MLCEIIMFHIHFVITYTGVHEAKIDVSFIALPKEVTGFTYFLVEEFGSDLVCQEIDRYQAERYFLDTSICSSLELLQHFIRLTSQQNSLF